MALEGNLAAFGLSEILQLIAVQQKTGMLTVTNIDVNTVMFFRNGEIISTRDRRRKARDTFQDYLTRYGVLGRDELIRISQISAQSKLDFTEILTSEGFLTPQELLTHWRKQVLESLHDVLTWEEGTYKFVPNQNIVDGIKSPEAFNVEGMLMESMRRIDEFPQLLEMFPSEKLIFTRRDNAPQPEELTDGEAAVHALLVGPITLRSLIAHAKMPVFEVYEALKLLRDKGLIRMEVPELDDAVEPEGLAVGHTRRRTAKNVLPFLVSLVALSGALTIGFHDKLNVVSPRVLADSEFLSNDPISRDRLEQKLRWLIEAYRAQEGDYPPNLSALESAGLVSADLIEKARSHAFRYRLTTDHTGYTLL